jgi:hypothetical protein
LDVLLERTYNFLKKVKADEDAALAKASLVSSQSHREAVDLPKDKPITSKHKTNKNQWDTGKGSNDQYYRDNDVRHGNSEDFIDYDDDEGGYLRSLQ